MLIYPKKHADAQKEIPVWKEDKFLWLRGFVDALVHKTDFKTQSGKTVLAGAYYVRIHRELEAFEAARVAQLQQALAPKVTALKAAARTAESNVAEKPRSTGAMRAARETSARRSRAIAERKELAASIRTELLRAEAEITAVYSRANASLVRYSKATKFRVLDEEIPCFTPNYSAHKQAKELDIEGVM